MKLTREQIAIRLHDAYKKHAYGRTEPFSMMPESPQSNFRAMSDECIKIAAELNAEQIAAAVEKERKRMQDEEEVRLETLKTEVKLLRERTRADAPIADAVRSAVPEGYEFVRIGAPADGEWFIGTDGTPYRNSGGSVQNGWVILRPKQPQSKPWDADSLGKITKEMEQEKAIADAVLAAVPEGMELNPSESIAYHSDNYTPRLIIYLRPKQPQAKPCPKCGSPAKINNQGGQLYGCSDPDCAFCYVSFALWDWNLLHYGPQPDLREAQAEAFDKGVVAGSNYTWSKNPYRKQEKP